MNTKQFNCFLIGSNLSISFILLALAGYTPTSDPVQYVSMLAVVMILQAIPYKTEKD